VGLKPQPSDHMLTALASEQWNLDEIFFSLLMLSNARDEVIASQQN
jgi:hypothetical protein